MSPRNTDSVNILGTFDFSSLLIKLNSGNFVPASASPDELEKALLSYDITVLAHELTHFVQAFTTASGLRTFFFLLKAVFLKLDILAHQVSANSGTLIAPILKRDAILNESYFELVRLYAHQKYIEGGWDVEVSEFSELYKVIPGLLYMKKDAEILGCKIDKPLFVVDMRNVDGTKRGVVLGVKHLRESSAKIIENLQGHLHGGSTFKLRPPSGKLGIIDIFRNNRIEKELSDPYFICNVLYEAVCRTSEELRKERCVEELFLLIDLALTYDHHILNYNEFMEKEHITKEDKEDFWKSDISPAEVFLSILLYFSKESQNLPRIPLNYTKEDVSKFQDAIVKGLMGVNTAELIKNTEEYAEWAFGRAEVQAIHKLMMHTYKDGFLHWLKFRREVLGGGAVLEDLLMDKEYILKIYRNWVPAFIANGVIISVGEFIEGVGVGVDMLRMQYIHEITDSLLFDGNQCPADYEEPRHCQAKRCRLCFLSDVTPDDLIHTPCVRGEILKVICSITGANSFKYISSRG